MRNHKTINFYSSDGFLIHIYIKQTPTQPAWITIINIYAKVVNLKVIHNTSLIRVVDPIFGHNSRASITLIGKTKSTDSILPQMVTSTLKWDDPKAFEAWHEYTPASCGGAASLILSLDVTLSISRISVVLDFPGIVR